MRAATMDLLRAAYSQFAVGAFNVCNMEQMHGLFRGATQARAPILVQFSRPIRNYAHPRMLEAMVRAAEMLYPDVTFAVHLDHGDAEACDDAITSGQYASIMIDGSHLPFEENIAVTSAVVKKAHAHGIAVEAELGQLQGIEEAMAHAVEEAILTDPAKAEEFVERTGCDALAVAIGTSHGAYKFSGRQRIDFERLAEIQRRLPEFPLVLHGGSAVPQNEVERINAAGGKLDTTASGVSASELTEAIACGVAKVNIGTDGRLVWTRVHREFFRDRPKEFDFAAPGRIYMDEFAAFVAAKCQQLGAAGRADSPRTIA
ncbi:MAG: class II fructose-bisphosphate aldolase [Verrucomicrobiota bacterium]